MNLARLLRAERSGRLGAGPGAAVHQTALGRLVRFKQGVADFSHPWLADADAASTQFLPGSINNVMAAIGGVPLAGTDKLPVPALEWTKLSLTSDGIGYLCAEVTFVHPDTADRTRQEAWSVSKVEMVQVADPDTEDGRPGKILNTSGGARPLLIKGTHRARWAVAMLQQREDSFEVFQIVYFNLTVRTALKADGRGAARHLFY